MSTTKMGCTTMNYSAAKKIFSTMTKIYSMMTKKKMMIYTTMTLICSTMMATFTIRACPKARPMPSTSSMKTIGSERNHFFPLFLA